jgi:hypothetical protein
MHSCNTFISYFPNILDVMVLENINLFSDKIGRPSLWSNETVAYIDCQQCIFQPHVNFISTMDLEMFNFSKKITLFAF